jgi:hypothetical protein
MPYSQGEWSENELFRKADHALYHAKASGRKQIRLAYEEGMIPKTTHYTQTQLERLSKLADERGVNDANLLRETMDDFLTKNGLNDIETYPLVIIQSQPELDGQEPRKQVNNEYLPPSAGEDQP